jgi:Dna[CI] antecedent, DciA
MSLRPGQRNPRVIKWSSHPTMERASKLIRGLRLPGDTITPEELACAAWPLAVGSKIAAHTRPSKMVRTRLIVEVEDRVWQRQLFALTRHILGNLAKNLGSGLVEDLEFRIVPRRREPQLATHSVAAFSNDEAEAIEDPVLRSIYRAARKKAHA